MPTHGKIDHFDPSQESWKSYAERLAYYFVANEIAAEKKKSILLTVCEPSTYELAKSLVQPKTLDEKSYDEIIKALEEHYCPKPSPIVQRFKFNSRQPRSGESMATYVAELRALAEHCAFGETLNDMIRDRLVCGVNDHNIQRRLLQEPELSYQKAFNLAVAMEAATKDVQDLRRSTPTDQLQHVQEHRQCYRCAGKNHTTTVCKFREARCRERGKKGHIARACNSRKFQKVKVNVETLPMLIQWKRSSLLCSLMWNCYLLRRLTVCSP